MMHTSPKLKAVAPPPTSSLSPYFRHSCCCSSGTLLCTTLAAKCFVGATDTSLVAHVNPVLVLMSSAKSSRSVVSSRPAAAPDLRPACLGGGPKVSRCSFLFSRHILKSERYGSGSRSHRCRSLSLKRACVQILFIACSLVCRANLPVRLTTLMSVEPAFRLLAAKKFGCVISRPHTHLSLPSESLSSMGWNCSFMPFFCTYSCSRVLGAALRISRRLTSAPCVCLRACLSNSFAACCFDCSAASRESSEWTFVGWYS
mmetsp:Transcript_18919/g.46029  ORF Transcript_18919/g.46029 Transcript_18919/m.46029 type:complete len:258 (-) Transcript_18919:240-1013(-)